MHREDDALAHSHRARVRVGPSFRKGYDMPRDADVSGAGVKQGAAEGTRLLQGATDTLLLRVRAGKLSVRFRWMALGDRMTAPGRQLRLARMQTT